MEGQDWSLSLTDWSEWKNMQVRDESNKSLSTDQLAAHIYYEMTWHGWPDSQEELRESLTSQIEKIELDFADYKKGNPLPEGYTEFRSK